MIKVIIELVPHGIPPGRVIAEGTIVNDGTGTDEIGNYKCFFTGHEGKVKIGSKVTDYKRRKYSVWYLLYLALKAFYERKRG